MQSNAVNKRWKLCNTISFFRNCGFRLGSF